MTLSALGIFSAAGAVGAPQTYELISTTILGSTTSTVTFDTTGLGSTYRHLQMRAVTRTNRSNYEVDGLSIRFNGDSGNNYSFHVLYNATTESYFNAGNQSIIWVPSTAGNTAPSNVFGPAVIDFFDAFSTTKNKTIRTLCGLNAGGTGLVLNRIHLDSGTWYNTAAITSISITATESTGFVAGNRFSLYGIRG